MNVDDELGNLGRHRQTLPGISDLCWCFVWMWNERNGWNDFDIERNFAMVGTCLPYIVIIGFDLAG